MAHNSDTQQSPYFPSSRSEITQVLSLGLAAGALIALLGTLLQRFFINPVFCSNTAVSTTVCGPEGSLGFYIATALVSILSVVALVRFGVFRPLLVAVGAAASLWGLNSQLAGLNFIEFVFWFALLFGVAYLLFYWLLRLSNFVISLVLVIVAIVLVRVVLSV